jgi:hypothetical protein
MSDSEKRDERPHCETPVMSGPEGICGSEQGLKKIIYMPNDLRDTVHCPKHFGDAWKNDRAERAEPVKTAKDNQ